MFNPSDLLGGLLQGGGPRGHATGRLEHAMGDRGLGGAGGPLGQILGGTGGGGGAGAPRGAGYGQPAGGGDILGSLATMLGASGLAARAGYGGGIGVPAGGTGGGLGGLAGGNMRGAIGAGGLALLGMLAMNALRNAGGRQQPAASPGPIGGADADTEAAMPPEQSVSDRTAHLVLRAMIDAAKADGQVDATERQRLVAKAQEGGADPEAAAFLERELERPADPDALAAEARGPVVAAQVYAASLLAIQVDTEEERAYLRALAGKLGLQPAVVAQLHQALGAPAA